MFSYYMRMNFRRLHASIRHLFLTTSTRSMADAFREVQDAPNLQVLQLRAWAGACVAGVCCGACEQCCDAVPVVLWPSPSLKDLVLEDFVPQLITVPEVCRVHAAWESIMPATAKKWLVSPIWKGIPGFSLASFSLSCQRLSITADRDALNRLQDVVDSNKELQLFDINVRQLGTKEGPLRIPRFSSEGFVAHPQVKISTERACWLVAEDTSSFWENFSLTGSGTLYIGRPSAADMLDWYEVQGYSGNGDGFQVLHMLQVESDDEADDASVCAEDDTSVSEGDGASYPDGDVESVSDGSADVEDDAEHAPPLHGDAGRCSNTWLVFWLVFWLAMVSGRLIVCFFIERAGKEFETFHSWQVSAHLGLSLLWLLCSGWILCRTLRSY